MRAHMHTHTHAPLGFIVWFYLLGAKNNTKIPQRAESLTWSNVNTFEDKGVWKVIVHEKRLCWYPKKEMITLKM